MKVIILVAIFVACVNGSKFSSIGEKLVPKFIGGYIINGKDAQPHSAPYIVSLSARADKYRHICGGALLNRDWILTAAHCISNAKGMGAVAGLHSLKDSGDRVQSREVDFGKNHHLYTGGVGPYDISILHVSESFVFNEIVQPVALPSRNEIPAGESVLYGWGQSKPFNFAATNTLQTVNTPIVPWDDCKAALPDNAPLHATNICIDSQQKSISACNGDSGGPLVQETTNGPPVLIGVVSWGYIPCGVANKPSIFTRVSAHVGWIADIQSSYYKIFDI